MLPQAAFGLTPMKNDHSVVKIKSFFAALQFLLAPPFRCETTGPRPGGVVIGDEGSIAEIKKTAQISLCGFLTMRQVRAIK
ncbi:hypothetical protein CF137_02425 [Aeromonas sobria]|nr:hypothetical protein CF137_02425 [Aeromonas sobria]